MSTSSALNRGLKKIYKLLAILLVIFAVLISMLRLFLPYAHNYRDNVESYINNTYNSNITIGALAMGWGKSGPTLVAEKVELIKSNRTDIFVESLAVEIDFWRSVRTRKLVTQDFIISGAEITVSRDLIDEAVVAKTDNLSDKNKPSLQESIERIFLEQISRFSIQDSHVFYHTQTGQRAFSINQMHWMNEEGHHKANGTIMLDGISSNNLKLLADFEGDEIDNLNGQIYLEANNINITPWLGQALALEDENTHSSINIDTWLDVRSGQAKSIRIAFGENEISWLHQGQAETFSISGGDLFIETLAAQEYKISTTPISIQRNDQKAQQLLFQSHVTQQNIDGYINRLSLSSFDGVFPLLFKDEGLESLLSDLSPTGTIDNIHFRKQQENFSLAASFQKINTHFSNGIPGINNISGDLVYHNDQLQMSLKATNGQLDFDKHFKQPIPYTEISTQLTAKFEEESWRFSISDAELASNELRLTADVKVEGGNSIETKMALLVDVSDGDAKFASHYFPHLLLGEELVGYLNGAIVAGKVNQAQVLFNGPLSGFPFHNNEGIFIVDAELSDATFAFDPEWPAIEKFSANLNFTNNSMLITGREGKLSGIDVTGVEAAIDELVGAQILTVDAKFSHVDPILVENLMNDSPMESSIGATLSDLQVSQTVDGKFSLILPLNAPEDVIAKGYVDFDNNTIALQAPRMDFTKVNGRLIYYNDVISAKDIKVDWRGLPLELNIAAQQSDNQYTVNINTLASWENEKWHAQLPDNFVSYGQGLLNWQGDLVLEITNNTFNYDYRITSTLEQVAFDLPMPFSKHTDIALPTKIHAYGNEMNTTIDAAIGDHVSFYGVLSHQKTQFSLAHLVLGRQQQWLPTSGFHITADLDNTVYEQWQPLVIDILDAINPKDNTVSNNDVASSTKANVDILPIPTSINGVINELSVFGEKLHDTAFEFTPKENWWLLDVNAKELRAEAKFYPDWLEQGIDIKADFIHINSAKTNGLVAVDTIEPENVENSSISEKLPRVIDQNFNDIIMANMPPLKVKCSSCKMGIYDFGDVSFSIERENENTLLLNNFLAKRDKTELALDARWHRVNDSSFTRLNGKLSSKSVEREVEKIGYASIIKDSGVKMNYDLNWQGAPHDFALNHFNGDVTAEFDDGYLADVDDKGVRILSILSLQSLVRKLSFDFRDIFSDGMFYSKLEGHFKIDNGVAYTDNIKMQGTAGDLIVIGNTNLNTGDLDYKMSYKPNLTSSLPVLAWIATLNPVTFLAGVALDEVITSSVIAEIKFEVTGNLEDPIVKQVSRKTQNISVGRSSPPKIVDSNPAQPNTNKEKSLNDIKNNIPASKKEKKIDG